MNVLLCDSSHPNSYDFDNLKQQAIGGTESSLLRVAAIMAAQQHQVIIFQQSRQRSVQQAHVLFVGPNQISQINGVDAIVVLRKDKQLKRWQQKFPHARTFLWLHTYKKWEFVFKRLFKHNRQSVLVGNSQIHANHLNQQLHENLMGRLMTRLGIPKLNVRFAYNPVPKPILKETGTRDLNKLIFLSAPNKGLTEVLEKFRHVRAIMPNLTLYVANPGYREQAIIDQPGVHTLGALPQVELWQHLAGSLCVFYPQTTFAETFGLIYAEANALGTPVLAHDMGAAREILHPKNPLINCHNNDLVTKTLQQWQEKLPTVKYRDLFASENIYKQWIQLLS